MRSSTKVFVPCGRGWCGPAVPQSTWGMSGSHLRSGQQSLMATVALLPLRKQSAPGVLGALAQLSKRVFTQFLKGLCFSKNIILQSFLIRKSKRRRPLGWDSHCPLRDSAAPIFQEKSKGLAFCWKFKIRLTQTHKLKNRKEVLQQRNVRVLCWCFEHVTGVINPRAAQQGSFSFSWMQPR